MDPIIGFFVVIAAMIFAACGMGYAAMSDIRRPLNEDEVARLRLLADRHPEVARLIAETLVQNGVFVAVDLEVAEREAANADGRKAMQRARKAMNDLAASVVAANSATGKTGAA
ncbi:hypothetical protein LGM58_35595 [Burkholderia contaminans]|uniref:hypothetical protein n=1 Tax=Burkholderia contaminans TaxID=488447 RepID=UPI001CF49540|nr:hypothetical protein [Burkholderia contaminans]MCA7888508.1 hypothetical protein [Burkholderia contaminans]